MRTNNRNRKSKSNDWRTNLRVVARAALCLPVCAWLLTSTAAAQEEIAAGVQCASSAATQPLPAGGEQILGDDALRRFAKAGADKIALSEVTVENQTFKRALRIETKAAAQYLEQISLTATNVAPIAAGDTLFMRWTARVVSADAPDKKGKAQFKTPAAFGALTLEATAAEDWKTYALPVPAWRTFAAGELKAQINVGATTRQTIEIGSLEFVNFKTKRQPAELPFSCVTYEGREKTAQWRVAAEQRIEKYRKADLRVAVFDKTGKALSDAAVSVKLVRHAYGFGSAISEKYLFAADATTRRNYQNVIDRYFSETVIENGLKWTNWANEEKRATTLEAVDWLTRRGVRVRGHTLVWASWRNSPAFLKQNYDRLERDKGAAAAKDYLRQTVEKHILEEVSALRGRVVDWDVVNETYANHDYTDLLGKQMLPEWFKLARRADPDARLFLNENTVETETSQKTDFFYNEIKFLQENNAPIGGIGIQAHVGAISIPSFLRNLDRFARLGLPIKITEFDMVTPDKELQADFTRDFLIAAFSHPATEAFLMWGFWDGAHWLYDAPLFNYNWSLKPSGKAYFDLVWKKWRTDVAGKTDSAGGFQTRGFLGDYEIVVTRDGKTQTVKTKLVREGATIKIVLD
jgi:endo-1,4-beta-xylanase